MNFDIPGIYLTAILKHLTTEENPQPTKSFLNARNDEERLRIVEEMSVPTHLEECLALMPTRHPKSNERADATRRLQASNEQVGLGKDYLSLLYYNISVATAVTGSEALALAYSDRADGLYDWEFFKLSLESVQLAKAAECSPSLLAKLNRREQLCRQAPREPKPMVFELSYAPHPTIPFMANCLFLRSGKGIHTNRHLKVGDVVAIEQPFAGVQYRDSRHSRCWHCLQYTIALIPCPDCTAIMFCGTECRDQAASTYHNYECPAIDLIARLESEVVFAMRMFLTALNLFDSVAEFQAFCNDPENRKDNIFKLNPFEVHSKEYLKLVLGAEPPVFDNAGLFAVMLAGGLAKQILLTYTTAANEFRTESQKKFLLEQLVKFAKFTHAKHYRTLEPTYGLRSYGFSKYLRHSCVPNVVRVYSGLKSYIFVLRPIALGEELFECYWHSREPEEWLSTQDWETVSQKHFNFVCTCDRCKFRRSAQYYRVLEPRVPMRYVGQEFSKISQISVFTAKYAKSEYKNFCDFIEKYKDFPRSVQLRCAEACLVSCWDILTQKFFMPGMKNN